MSSFNKVILMGNLTRDPQVKHPPSNTVVAEFGLACNRRFKTASGEDREEVAFVDCTAFGRQAQTIAQYCTRGNPLFVEGRLKYDQWDEKLSPGGLEGAARKRSKLSVVVENFQFVGSRESGSAQSPPRGHAERHRDKAAKESPVSQEKQFEEADIPF